MKKLSDLFHVSYGNKLDKNKMSEGTVNFIGRSEYNNGVTAKVAEIPDITPYESGLITVALGGSVLSSFLQSAKFYTGQNVAVLTPKINLSQSEKIYYCALIKANAFRFTACGREANRFLSNLQIPSEKDIPEWVQKIDSNLPSDTALPISNITTENLDVNNWKPFFYNDIFIIKKGKRLTKAQMTIGTTPYIGAVDSKNGVSSMIGQAPIHMKNTISLSYNGSVAEAFYQPLDFWATDDVNVLYPKFKCTAEVLLFLCALIRKEKYRFNYGRKWTMDKMNKSIIKLPVKIDGNPDFELMGNYIKSLPYSSQI
jgi:hypothetical protein